MRGLCINSVSVPGSRQHARAADDPQEIVFGMARERGAAEIINERTDGMGKVGRKEGRTLGKQASKERREVCRNTPTVLRDVHSISGNLFATCRPDLYETH